MPFGEALFWIGVTVAGTGAWILWERHVKSTVWSLIFTALGVLAVAYSVYLPSHPNAPNPPVWVILLLLTWGTFGWIIYDKKRTVERKAAQLEPSKLTIHYAFYGIGNSNDIDLAETLQKMVPMDALAVTINNNLIVGRPDPAPNQLKTLRIAYSYGGHKNVQFSRPEHTLLVLPRDIELLQETAGEYERKRQVDVGTLETKLQEKDRDSVSNLEEIGRYRRELNRLEDEKSKLQNQLNLARSIAENLKAGLAKPKLVLVVVQYEAQEIVGKMPATQSGLWRTTYNTIIIRAKLRISNEHGVDTKVYSTGISVYENSPQEAAKTSGVPIKTDNELLEPIVLGYPREGWIEFSFDHTDAQWIARRKFQISVVDGTDAVWITAPETIRSISQRPPLGGGSMGI
jgi:hypothetical protein